MGRLINLLKNKKSKLKESTKLNNIQVKKTNVFQSKYENTFPVVNNYEITDLSFDLTDNEIKEIRNSIFNEINTNGKDRKQIIIGMFGGIKNPRNGKRFVIPGLTYDTEDYIYQYARYMQMLVNRPEEFKKIMNWE